MKNKEIIEKVLKNISGNEISYAEVSKAVKLTIAEKDKQIQECEKKLKEETRHFDGWGFSNDAKEFRKIIDKVFSECFGDVDKGEEK